MSDRTIHSPREVTSAWNHERAKEWSFAHSRILQAERATRAYEAAKAAATEAVRLACRLETAATRDGAYHESLSRSATLRHATAEIAKQEAIIAKAQRLLKEARAALARAEEKDVPDNSAWRHQKARDARARATHLQEEARRLKSAIRAVSVTSRLYHRRQELFDMLSRLDSDDCRVSVTPDRIVIGTDKNGDPGAIVYTLDENEYPASLPADVTWPPLTP